MLVRVGPVTVRPRTRDDALACIAASVGEGGSAVFSFCNAHSVNLARASPDFSAALASATVFNDGIGMDIAARLLSGTPFPANLQGTDLTSALLAALPARTPVYLIGSPPGVALEACKVLRARFPSIDFVGAEHGWFTPADEPAVAARIKASGARLVIAGMGQPRQELWAGRHASALGIVCLCVGAYLDFTAGRFRRAPAWVQRVRLEWAFRLVQEPRRLAQRYLIGNVTFVAGILADKRRARRS